MFALDFKARIDSFAYVQHKLHKVDSSDSFLSETHADYLVASMAAQSVTHILV